MTAKVGIKGQIVIPKVFRDHLEIFPGTEVTVSDENNKLVLAPKRQDMVDVFAKLAHKINHKGKINMNDLYEEEMKAKHGLR